MRYIKYIREVIEWCHRIDKWLSSGNCNTNPLFATFAFNIFLLMGVLRPIIIPGAEALTLDDVYYQLSPQAMGVGIQVFLYLLVESVALMGRIEDKLMRFVVFFVMFNAAYVFGIYFSFVGQLMLLFMLVCYFINSIAWVVEEYKEISAKKYGK